MSQMTTNKQSARGKNALSSFGLLLLSLFMAIVLWYICTAGDETSIQKSFTEIRVVYTNSAVLREMDLTPTDMTPDIKVSAVLKGNTSDILNISSDDIIAVVDLAEIKGEGKQTTKPKIQGLPEGVTVSKIDSVDVDIEKVIKKNLVLSLELVGTPADGYSVDRKNIIYSKSVNITCGETLSHNVSGAKIVLDVSNRSQSYEVNLNVILLDSLGNEISTEGISFDHQSVNVSVNVTADIEIG